MCTNEELKQILDDQVIPALGDIQSELQETTARSIGNEESIAGLNDKLDEMPEKFIEIVDQRNLFYVRSAGRRLLAVGGALLMAMCGAVAAELFGMWF